MKQCCCTVSVHLFGDWVNAGHALTYPRLIAVFRFVNQAIFSSEASDDGLKSLRCLPVSVPFHFLCCHFLHSAGINTGSVM